MSAIAWENKEGTPLAAHSPAGGVERKQRVPINRQHFELNVNQIEYFAPIWVDQPVIETSCTFIVLLRATRLCRPILMIVDETRAESHSGAELHWFDAARHKFGPLLASIARFFGISRTYRWKV
jgi:hypothetical protein